MRRTAKQTSKAPSRPSRGGRRTPVQRAIQASKTPASAGLGASDSTSIPATGSARTPAEFLTDYRRDQLLAAAREVIAALGFERLSVGEVVKAAGLSRSTFYGYFASKDDLLAALLASGRGILAA